MDTTYNKGLDTMKKGKFHFQWKVSVRCSLHKCTVLNTVHCTVHNAHTLKPLIPSWERHFCSGFDHIWKTKCDIYKLQSATERKLTYNFISSEIPSMENVVEEKDHGNTSELIQNMFAKKMNKTNKNVGVWHRELCCSAFAKKTAEDLAEQYGGDAVCVFLCQFFCSA